MSDEVNENMEFVYGKSGKIATLQNWGLRNPTKRKEKTKMSEEKSNKPDYDVIVGTKGKREDAKTFWTKIGSAWVNDDKISVKLNALPVGDSMVLVKPKPKEESK